MPVWKILDCLNNIEVQASSFDSQCLPCTIASAPEAAAGELFAHTSMQTQVKSADGNAGVALCAAEALGTKTSHLPRLVSYAGAAVWTGMIASL